MRGIRLMKRRRLRIFHRYQFRCTLRLSTVIVFRQLTFCLHPFLVNLCVTQVKTMRAQRRRIRFISVFMFLVNTKRRVAIFLIFILLSRATPNQFTFYHSECTTSSLIFTLCFQGMNLPVGGQNFAMLFAYRVNARHGSVTQHILIRQHVNHYASRYRYVQEVTCGSCRRTSRSHVRHLSVRLLTLRRMRTWYDDRGSHRGVATASGQGASRCSQRSRDSLRTYQVSLITRNFPSEPSRRTYRGSRVDRCPKVMERTWSVSGRRFRVTTGLSRPLCSAVRRRHGSNRKDRRDGRYALRHQIQRFLVMVCRRSDQSARRIRRISASARPRRMDSRCSPAIYV